ncbi:putative lipoprotein [Mycobacteroides abscessus subsp. bolletii 1513]|uniref:Putative lipoprotein n=1 Tax=Mycobacteroides abscessus subsp. bolletii 1513 TaxID=1299321 RepID=X8DUA9_9MYCO|nr:putative lipoprotein [Mycobacteroides abscessus subsp. bolletii 1513]
MSVSGAARVPRVLLLAAIVLLVLTGCARTVAGTASAPVEAAGWGRARERV